MTGITMGIFNLNKLSSDVYTKSFQPIMEAFEREEKYQDWKEPISLVSYKTK
ncbi:MAG TPA: hypothetical protein VN258_00135 [Mobilitalea sp.]|nr:hypothetical protein [Mobilitalea sp.]